MSNPFSLVFGIPVLFFSTITSPFSTSYMTLVPAVGVLCLLAGSLAAYMRPRKALLWAPASVLSSQVYVALVGLLRGSFHYDFLTFGIVFLCAQLACLVPLVYFSKGTRAAAILLFVFCAIYALFTHFFAVMWLTDEWI